MRVEIVPVWRFRHQDGRAMLVMLDFLGEIRATGTITHAAAHAHLSYRHSWNLIEKWSEFFGAPLVERSRGRGTHLTALGEKLVSAGQRLRARLRPQLQNLAWELETEIKDLLPQPTNIVRVHANHGFAVTKLREILGCEPGSRLDLRYVSGQSSLVSLGHGGCELAGVHVPQGEMRKKNIAALRPWLVPREHRVIGFVTREMGLMVKRGNPLRITSLQSLFDNRVRFVNRDPDSPTRRLFDQMLAQHGLDEARLDGYQHIEFTHPAVAAYVASGVADASFGVEAVARQFHLDFVRLVMEDYFFVCRKHVLEHEGVKKVLTILRSEEFQAAIAQLPGYAAKDAGVIKGVREALR